MPLQKCTKDGQTGYRWGDEGVCYIGENAKQKAIEQGIAIEGPETVQRMLNMPKEETINFKTIWTDVFKSGTHIDSAGNKKEWTDSELEDIVKNTNELLKESNPNRRDVPLILGHEEESKAPAFGWIKALKKLNDKIFAKIDVTDKFETLVKDGLYKHKSIALWPNLTMRHLAALGAAQPAVAGLTPLGFADTHTEETYTYKYEADHISNDVPEGIVEDAAEEPKDEVEILKKENAFFKKLFEAFKIDINKNTEEFTSDINEENDMSKELEQKIEELEAQVAEKDSKIAEMSASIQAKADEARMGEHKAFCDTLVQEGKLLPKDVDTTVENMELRFQADQNKFAAAKEGEEVQSSLESYKKALSETEVQVDTKEFATKSDATEGSVEDRFMSIVNKKVDGGMNYSAALKAAQMENIELAQEYYNNQ